MKGDNNMESISERLNALMQRYNLKQTDLAKRTGLNRATISYYISGKRIPARDNIFAIAKAFDVDPAWLMGYDVPMFAKKPNIEEKYAIENADLLNCIKNDEGLKSLVRNYLMLTENQKKSVVNLIASMISNP